MTEQELRAALEQARKDLDFNTRESQHYLDKAKVHASMVTVLEAELVRAEKAAVQS
jgi:hypothetical protein